MILPVNLSGKKERMALMEAAISSSLVHNNTVKTHTYSIKPIREKRLSSSDQIQQSSDAPRLRAGISQLPDSGPSYIFSEASQLTAFEVQIVLEHCDMGTLRGALNAGIFHPSSSPNYPAIVDVALDIVQGMQHLHSCNIIHADLKASNILLKSSPDSSKGFDAKVADFGLSIAKVDADETHVSNMMQGTTNHMSPECLMTGQQSNAGDVYSFGITLFELFTAAQAFRNIHHAFLAHKVANDHLRPMFPPGTPSGYKDLAEACWDPVPSARPTFDSVVATLRGLQSNESAPVATSRLSFTPDPIQLPITSNMTISDQDFTQDGLVSYQAEGLNMQGIKHPLKDQDLSNKPPVGIILGPIDSSSYANEAGSLAAIAQRPKLKQPTAVGESEADLEPQLQGIVVSPVDGSSVWK